MPASAKAMCHYDDTTLIFSPTVHIARQFLSLSGGKLIFCALQPVKIIHIQHKRLAALKSLVKIFVVHHYCQGPIAGNDQYGHNR